MPFERNLFPTQHIDYSMILNERSLRAVNRIKYNIPSHNHVDNRRIFYNNKYSTDSIDFCKRKELLTNEFNGWRHDSLISKSTNRQVRSNNYDTYNQADSLNSTNVSIPKSQPVLEQLPVEKITQAVPLDNEPSASVTGLADFFSTITEIFSKAVEFFS